MDRTPSWKRFWLYWSCITCGIPSFLYQSPANRNSAHLTPNSNLLLLENVLFCPQRCLNVPRAHHHGSSAATLRGGSLHPVLVSLEAQWCKTGIKKQRDQCRVVLPAVSATQLGITVHLLLYRDRSRSYKPWNSFLFYPSAVLCWIICDWPVVFLHQLDILETVAKFRQKV